ncbi:MAG: zinc ribbon domain-containing protein [Candidatus Thorarchaeota archaeon]
MKIRELLLFVIGFVMVSVGALLITDSSSGGVFVFPFFFVGDALLAPIIIIISLVTMLAFFYWANSQFTGDARFSKYQDPSLGVLKIESMCQVCGSPLPENASFCSACGSSVDRDSF